MGRPPKRQPLNKQDLAFLKYQRAVNETGKSLPLPKHPHVLGPLAHLLYCQIEGLDEKTAAVIEFDSDTIHLNPLALRPPEALRLIVRLLLIINKSLDPGSAAANQLMLRHVTARELQIQDTTKPKSKTTDARRYSRVFDDARFEALIFDQIRGKHDVTEMKKQREIVLMYIAEHPLPGRRETVHETKRVFQNWMDDHKARLVPQLKDLPCLCGYHYSRPIKLFKRMTNDETDEKFKTPSPLDLACKVLGHIHDLDWTTIGKLLKQKTPE